MVGLFKAAATLLYVELHFPDVFVKETCEDTPLTIGNSRVATRAALYRAENQENRKFHFRSPKIGRKHPSRDVIFSGQNLAKKCEKLSLYMTSSNL